MVANKVNKNRFPLFKKNMKRRSRYTCIVMNCYSREGPGTRFYLFPKNETLRKRWIENLKLEDISPTKRRLLCNHHFEDICFVEDTLKIKKNSVPTLALGHNGSPKHNNNIENLGSEKPKQRRKCCIKNCKPRPTSIFHKFPTDPQLRQKWCIACNIDETNVGPRTYVCHEHFTYEYHGIRNVLKDGIPTVNLNVEEKRNIDETLNSEDIKMEKQDDLSASYVDVKEEVEVENDVLSARPQTVEIDNNNILRVKESLMLKLKGHIDELKDIVFTQLERIRMSAVEIALQQQKLCEKDVQIESLKATITELQLRCKEEGGQEKPRLSEIHI